MEAQENMEAEENFQSEEAAEAAEPEQPAGESREQTLKITIAAGPVDPNHDIPNRRRGHASPALHDT